PKASRLRLPLRAKIRQARPLFDEHAIAVREEFIALLHGVFVCAENVLASGKARYQHQQSGLRQVKIGQQRSHGTKLKSRVDEDIGFSGLRNDFTMARL